MGRRFKCPRTKMSDRDKSKDREQYQRPVNRSITVPVLEIKTYQDKRIDKQRVRESRNFRYNRPSNMVTSNNMIYMVS